MEYEQLKLDNQVCFPVYAASRLITRAYQPLLGELGITYPQYLVLMVLWEEDRMSVNSIAERLILNPHTLPPLLKRMEENGLLSRSRAADDERRVVVSLTGSGRSLREKAAAIPEKLLAGLAETDLSPDEIIRLRDTLNRLVTALR